MADNWGILGQSTPPQEKNWGVGQDPYDQNLSSEEMAARAKLKAIYGIDFTDDPLARDKGRTFGPELSNDVVGWRQTAPADWSQRYFNDALVKQAPAPSNGAERQGARQGLMQAIAAQRQSVSQAAMQNQAGQNLMSAAAAAQTPASRAAAMQGLGGASTQLAGQGAMAGGRENAGYDQQRMAAVQGLLGQDMNWDMGLQKMRDRQILENEQLAQGYSGLGLENTLTRRQDMVNRNASLQQYNQFLAKLQAEKGSDWQKYLGTGLQVAGSVIPVVGGAVSAAGGAVKGG